MRIPRTNRWKNDCKGGSGWLFLLRCYFGGSQMSAEATQNVLRGSPASYFCRVFPRSLREAAFCTRRKQKTLDINPPRGSKITLSPRRRASFQKITFFPLDSFPARPESPRGSHFGPLFWPQGSIWTPGRRHSIGKTRKRAPPTNH